MTLIAAPATGRLRLHAGAGAGFALAILNSSLVFSNPAAATHALPHLTAGLAPELHAQCGLDYRVGERWGLGLLGRWSWARSNLTLRRGLVRPDSRSERYSDSRAAGDLGGLSLPGAVWARF